MKKKIDHTGYLRVIFLVLPYIFVVGAFELVGFILAGLDTIHANAIKTSEQSIIVSFFGFLGTLIIIWIFTRFVDNEKFLANGFYPINVTKESIAGFSTGVFAIVFGFIILTQTNKIIPSNFSFNQKEFFFAMLLFIIVAVSEEILFRGYILRNLMISFNKYVALIISALIFSLMHLGNPDIDTIPLISLFLSGILYGTAFIYNKRLWFPIFLHFSWNLSQPLLGFNVSGIRHYAFLEIENTGKQIFTGGEFGFEGSVYSVLIHVILIIGIVAYFEWKKRTTTLSPG